MRRGGQFSGLVTLATLLCVLCLCIFAVLTLVAARREQSLSARAALRAEEYYAADAAAVAQLAALDAASVPEGEILSFSFPSGAEQTLEVSVQKQGDGFEILRWQTVYSGAWEAEEGLSLWDGP